MVMPSACDSTTLRNSDFAGSGASLAMILQRVAERQTGAHAAHDDVEGGGQRVDEFLDAPFGQPSEDEIRSAHAHRDRHQRRDQRIVGLEVGQHAERRGDGDEDQQVLLFLHRQAGLLDARLQIDALASRTLVELGEVLLDLLLFDVSIDGGGARARVGWRLGDGVAPLTGAIRAAQERKGQSPDRDRDGAGYENHMIHRALIPSQ